MCTLFFKDVAQITSHSKFFQKRLTTFLSLSASGKRCFSKKKCRVIYSCWAFFCSKLVYLVIKVCVRKQKKSSFPAAKMFEINKLTFKETGDVTFRTRKSNGKEWNNHSDQKSHLWLIYVSKSYCSLWS